MRIIISLLCLFSAISAQAIPLEWTLDNVVFSDGGTASGSFFYDDDTDIYSNVAVTTTTGSVLTGTNYQYGSPYAFNAAAVRLTEGNSPDLTGEQSWLMGFGEGEFQWTELTNAGGTVPIHILYGSEGVCMHPTCGEVTQFRSVVSGTVSAVPVPAAVWLFGSALAGLGWIRRKQTA